MANVKTLKVAFSGGEISPEMHGRIDDGKYQSGAAKMLNFVTLPHGPAVSRPGFAFVREVKDSAKTVRLIPFTYSTTQTMVIELGAGYFRFHTQGATLLDGSAPYELANPYAEADLFDIHYVQSADVLTLVHPNYAPRELRRLGATSWQLSTIAFTPSVSPPSSVKATSQGYTTAKYSYQYVVTAIGADGVEESQASAKALGADIAISGVTKANPGVLTTSAAHGLTVGDPLKIAGVGGMTQLNDNTYTVATVPSTTTMTIKDSTGAVVDTSSFGTYTSGGTLTQLCVRGNLLETGCTNTISWTAVSGATCYNVYKMQGGLFGYIGQTTGISMVDDDIDPDLSKTPPTYESVFSAAGEYPGAVSYFEQRRAFAGSANKPQNIWMTKSGTESNMSYSLPIRDDDRIAFRVAAREANTIRHIVPLSQLLLLTGAAEWRVTSLNSDAITPSTISVRPQSYVGASNVQPVIANNSLIYAAARGGHVRELGFNWQANGFVSGDLSLRATHLFDTLEIVDMANAKSPYPIVWFVSSNGKLLGLTYVPEQQVGAWHQHETLDGSFESVAVVSEGTEDALYAVIKRGSVRYIERMGSFIFPTLADVFRVDCGLTYSGAAASTISGLDHLEGKTVSILADGAVMPQRVVTGGAIELDTPASLVHIGLPITSDLQTLPAAMQVDNAMGQGRYKAVNKVWLRVYRSSGIFAGPDADNLAEAKQRTTEPFGTPPALKSQEIEIMLPPSWGDSGQVYVRQIDPLPLTIVSLTLEIALGG